MAFKKGKRESSTMRLNRIVTAMARCMFAEKKMPKKFCADAVYTTVDLLNRLSTKVVQGKTPFEAWNGKKPKAKHLEVFVRFAMFTFRPKIEASSMKSQKKKSSLPMTQSQKVTGSSTLIQIRS